MKSIHFKKNIMIKRITSNLDLSLWLPPYTIETEDVVDRILNAANRLYEDIVPKVAPHITSLRATGVWHNSDYFDHALEYEAEANIKGLVENLELHVNEFFSMPRAEVWADSVCNPNGAFRYVGLSELRARLQDDKAILLSEAQKYENCEPPVFWGKVDQWGGLLVSFYCFCKSISLEDCQEDLYDYFS